MFYYIALNDINKALSQFNLSPITSLSLSNFEEFDYQSSVLLKHSKLPDLKNFTQYLISYLQGTGHYLDIQITGKGFVSLKVNPSSVLKTENNLHQLITHKKKNIIIDYCGVNVAKKMHIGHIRSMFIGDYIANTHQFLGDNVIKFNHIGDWGNQFGYLLQYIINFLNKDEIAHITNEELTSIYKKAYSLYCEDEEFKIQSNQASLSLYKKEEPYFSLWKKCCDISITEMNNTTKFFKVGIDQSNVMGESQYYNILPFIEEELIQAGIALAGEDGSVVYINKDKTPLLLKKSNGAYLYAMYDLAAIKYRLEKYNPDKILYVVDKRQADHFKSVFEIAKKANWCKANTELKHISFGFISDKNGKPLKTKSGDSLYLDDLIEKGFDQLLSNQYYTSLPDGYKELVINKTLIGSLKFFDLHFSYLTDYKFDWDKVLSNSGGAAPYVMHAYVRLDSIINKANVSISEDLDISLFSDKTLSLFKKLYQLKEAVYLYSETYSSHLIEESLLNLCNEFHYFYENENIINSENKENLISLVHQIKEEINTVLSILGVESYPSISSWSKNIK